MNKTDLVNNIAKETGFTKKDTQQVVDLVFDNMRDSLSKGEKVQVIDFGTFEIRKRSARKGRNPQTGEEINIPEHNTPSFKAGKGLKDSIKQ